MSDVSIAIVKEFFEENHFLIKINRKYIATKRQSKDTEEIDLFVMNTKLKNEEKLSNFVINPEDINQISKAIIKIKGWHTESFSPAVLTTFPKMLKFAEPNVVKSASLFFGTKDFYKILIVPSLPVTNKAKERSIEILKEKGISGVMEFKSILYAVTKMVQPNRNYFESDNLQLIRLFKIYDMLKGGQLELFGRRRKKVNK